MSLWDGSGGELRLGQLTDDNAFVNVNAVLGSGRANISSTSSQSHGPQRSGRGCGSTTGHLADVDDQDVFDREMALRATVRKQRSGGAEECGNGETRGPATPSNAAAAAHAGLGASNPFFRGRINMNKALLQQHQQYLEGQCERGKLILRSSGEKMSSSDDDVDTKRVDRAAVESAPRCAARDTCDTSGSPLATATAGAADSSTPLLIATGLRKRLRTAERGWKRFEEWRRNAIELDGHLSDIKRLMDSVGTSWMHYSASAAWTSVASPALASSSKLSQVEAGEPPRKKRGESKGHSVVDQSGDGDHAEVLLPQGSEPKPAKGSSGAKKPRGGKYGNSSRQLAEGPGPGVPPPALPPSYLSMACSITDGAKRGGMRLCSVCLHPASYRCQRCKRDQFCSTECHVVHEATRCLKFLQ